MVLCPMSTNDVLYLTSCNKSIAVVFDRNYMYRNVSVFSRSSLCGWMFCPEHEELENESVCWASKNADLTV
jgi:hypothetical protein